MIKGEGYLKIYIFESRGKTHKYMDKERSGQCCLSLVYNLNLKSSLIHLEEFLEVVCKIIL